MRGRRGFAALSASRTRGRSGPLWVVRADAPSPSPDDSVGPAHRSDVAVAYAIGAGVGTAVVRNRLRRRLRALMTELDDSHRLATGLYLVGATPAAAPLGFGELRRHLLGAFDDLDRRTGRHGAA